MEGEPKSWQKADVAEEVEETYLIISDFKLRFSATELGATLDGMPVDSECLTLACKSNSSTGTDSKSPRLELACLSHLIIVINAIPTGPCE